MFEKTPAQKLGLPPSGSPEANNNIFIGVAWFVAWVALVVGVILALVAFDGALGSRTR